MKHLSVVLSALAFFTLAFLNIGMAADSCQTHGQVIPVLNDGSEATVLEFTLDTEGGKTLTAISFDTTGTTALGDIGGYGIHQSSQFMVVRSMDHGQSWGRPENWTRQVKRESWWLFAPAPGNGITMRDGTLVMPSQGRDAKGFPFSNITWSKDHGKTWQVSAPARDDTSECAVAELSDGSLMLNIRDNRNRKDKSETNGRAVAVSQDLGKTWQKHSSDHRALPEPTCMASLISHNSTRGQHLLFFSNPHDKKSRSHMTIQMSEDDGKTWPDDRHILLDSGSGNGYSSLVIIDQQTIGILYESSVADLVFQKIPLAEFVE